MDGSKEFYRNWSDYQNGFGNKSREFWLDKKNIARTYCIVKHIIKVLSKIFLVQLKIVGLSYKNKH